MDRSPRELLYGRDDTPGIVSVAAGRDGTARVWRRVGNGVVCEDARFPHWLLVSDATLLNGLPVERLPGAGVADWAAQLAAHGPVNGPPWVASAPDAVAAPVGPAWVGLVELAGDLHYRYLVLAHWQDALERAIVDAHNARTGGTARALSALGDVAYVRPPVEQYLTWSGRTYYRGMAFGDVRRLQFDIETTGFNRFRDRIFMIAVRDSTGFETVLDGTEEEAVLHAFADVVSARDPDAIENHNLFDFDVPFLVERASKLGVPLPLGRDGSPFTKQDDTLKIGERNERFTRWCLGGRELIDTLHAVRRYAAINRDVRSRGLKSLARHFGIARAGREYVPGAETWSTYRRDPERMRRYALDDVREADGLARLLLGSPFALASMVPKPYERIATAGWGQGLIEPLMVRAYVTLGHSLPRAPGTGGTFAGAFTEVYQTGIVRRIVKADVASLYPSIMLAFRIKPQTDALDAFPALLHELTALRLHHKALARGLPPDDPARAHHDAAQGAMKVLINSFYGAMGTPFALFGDLDAAARVTERGRAILQQMLAELRARGVTPVEADTDGVLFSVPEAWTEADEHRLIDEVAAALPAGIQVEHDGRYESMYSHAVKNYVLREYDGRIRSVGSAFRSSRSERYGEQFLADAMGHILADDRDGLRSRYVALVRSLRARAVSVRDLCVTMPLTKAPATYRSAKRREEPYEVLLASGRTTWRTGERIRYYQAVGGQKKLLEHYADDYDPEPYVKKLRTMYAARLTHALGAEALRTLFADPADGAEGEAQAALFGGGGA